jgi:hypothetical protein
VKKRFVDVLFLVILILLVFLKLPVLNTPAVGDSLSLAVLSLAQPEESLLSWTPYVGHPPLIQILLRVFSTIQPYYVGVPNALSLVFSLIAMTFLYLLMKMCGKPILGLASCTALAFTPLFFTQAGMLNLDMPATAMILGGFYFFSTGRYGFFIFFSTLAVLTKEPTMLIFGIMAAFKLFWERRFGFIAVIKRNITLGIPVLALLGWWLFCRLHFGWWVDPLHGYYFSYKPGFFPAIINFLFFREWRWLLFLAMALLVFSSLQKKHVFISLGITFACSLFFSFIFNERYLLIALPFVYLAYGLALPEKRLSIMLYLPVIAVLLMGIAPAAERIDPHEQGNMNYIKIANLHKSAFDYLDTVIQENDSLLANWPHNLQALDPALGYAKRVINVVNFEGIANWNGSIGLPQFAINSNTYEKILKPQFDRFQSLHYERVFLNNTYGNYVEVLKRKHQFAG